MLPAFAARTSADRDESRGRAEFGPDPASKPVEPDAGRSERQHEEHKEPERNPEGACHEARAPGASPDVG